MSEIVLNGVSGTESVLVQLLQAENIVPGTQAGYELCKQLWIYHPLAGKIVEKPIRLAMSKKRKVTVDCNLKEMIVEAFEKEWEKLNATNYIRDVMFINRTYGAAAIVYGAKDIPTSDPIDPWKLPDLEIYFNAYDPLNLAGSIVTNQNPNAPDFQKPWEYITAAGQPYHPSRSQVMFNGTPIYLAFQSSAFGFTGRSVFQRALYPLKSFISSMVTDDLVSMKAGLIVTKLKPSGSVVNRVMQGGAGIKRSYLQQSVTGNVLSVDIEESIESIDLNNTNTAMTVARDNIIANVATSTDVPALLLKDEAFTQGFGEGSEDAKAIVQYLEGIREDMAPLYAFFDKIVQHRAWNKGFFETLKELDPDTYGKMSYEQAFYMWQEEFKAEWDSLIEEPMSEKVKTEEVKLRGIIEMARTLLPVVDPDNKARIVEWMTDNINEMQDTFKSQLNIDFETLADYEPPVPIEELKEPKPSASGF